MTLFLKSDFSANIIVRRYDNTSSILPKQIILLNIGDYNKANLGFYFIFMTEVDFEGGDMWNLEGFLGGVPGGERSKREHREQIYLQLSDSGKFIEVKVTAGI